MRKYLRMYVYKDVCMYTKYILGTRYVRMYVKIAVFITDKNLILCTNIS
jgi:hypothetical protein